MDVPYKYISNFIKDPQKFLESFQKDLEWERRGSTPRMEYYINKIPIPYTYGSGRGVRTYQPKPTHPLIEEIFSSLKELTGHEFEVCFLNRYLNHIYPN